MNRLSPEAWRYVAAEGTVDELEALAKALTVFEAHFKWLGGSVAAAIWVFREIEKRDPDRASQVADRILPRTTNRWVPYGSDNLGARSVTEYRALREERRRRTEANLEAERRRQEAAKVPRRASRGEERARRHATRLTLHQTRTQKRHKLIAELDALDPVERRRRVVRNDDHSLEYYPLAYLSVDDATLGQVEREILSSLADRTRHYRSGALRRLHERIDTFLTQS